MTEEIIHQKRCPTCDETKTTADFYRNRSKHDGLSVQCKKCHNAYFSTEKGKSVYRTSQQRNVPNRIERNLAAFDALRLSRKIPQKKRCAVCKQEKARTRFYPSQRTKDFLTPQCKTCLQQIQKDYARKAMPRIVAQAARWSKAHPEKRRAIQAKYKQGNLDKYRNHEQQRRARRRSASGYATDAQIQARVDFYGGLCWMCKKAANSIDHVIPLARGGSHWPSNLRPACTSCNSKKGARVVT